MPNLLPVPSPLSLPGSVSAAAPAAVPNLRPSASSAVTSAQVTAAGHSCPAPTVGSLALVPATAEPAPLVPQSPAAADLVLGSGRRAYEAGKEIVAYWEQALGVESAAAAAPTCLADLPPAERALCTAKHRLVTHIEQARAAKPLADVLIAARYLDWAPLETAAVTASNYYRWRQQLTRGGRLQADPVLLRRDYASAAIAYPGSPEWWAVFFGLYLSPQQRSLKLCWEQARTEYLRLHRLTTEGDVPSYDQVKRHVRAHLSPAVRELKRRGSKWFDDHFLASLSRDWSGVGVNDIWFSDHHQLDILCQTTAADGSTQCARPWLTTWRDAASGYLVSWALFAGHTGAKHSRGGSNHLAILDTFAQGIVAAQLHPPRTVYLDNGADYRKQGLFLPLRAGEHDWSIAAALGVQVKWARGENGREKPIERDFRDLCELFARRYASYTGSDTTRRPEEMQANIDPRRLPTVDQVRADFAEFLRTDWMQRPRARAIIGDGRPPADSWAAYLRSCPPIQNPQSKIQNLRSGLFLPYRESTVGRGGAVQVQHPYAPRATAERDRLYYHPALAKYWQQRVLVSVWWRDDSAVQVHDLATGRRICLAFRAPKVAALGEDGEIIGRINAALRAPRREALAEYDALLAPLAEDSAALVRTATQLPPATPDSAAPGSAPGSAALQCGSPGLVSPAPRAAEPQEEPVDPEFLAEFQASLRQSGTRPPDGDHADATDADQTATDFARFMQSPPTT